MGKNKKKNNKKPTESKNHIEQKIFDLTDIEIPETISVKDLAEKLKKQASEVCREEATRSGMFYMTERWLGGTLTNFKTIRRRVKRLDNIEKMENDKK